MMRALNDLIVGCVISGIATGLIACVLAYRIGKRNHKEGQ